MNQIDVEKFQSLVPQITDEMLSRLALAARFQGISERDIYNGISVINQLKSSPRELNNK